MPDKLEERLREVCIDWTGEPIVDDSTPRYEVLCGLLREAADEITRLKGEVEELNRQLGGGCEANGGGDHVVIKQGTYAFCGDCGESLRGIRYWHLPKARSSGKAGSDA